MSLPLNKPINKQLKFSRKKSEAMPTKRSMNLYFKPDKTSGPATIALYTIFAVIVALALAKFLFFDQWMQVMNANEQAAAAKTTLNGLTSQLANYNDVKAEYMQYAGTTEESKQMNRIKVLDLLESVLDNTGSISNITIKDKTVTLQVSGLALSRVSSIAETLEDSDAVASITVNTAASATDGGNSDIVSASMNITLADDSK